MWLLIFVFAAFFLAVAMVAFSIANPRSKEAKQTVSRLESITAPQSRNAQEESQSIRLTDQLSTIPWLDRLLQKGDISERLRLLLYQADLKWTVGRLLLLSASMAFAVGALVLLRTGALLLAFGLGAGAAGVPLLYVLQQRSSRFDRMRLYLPEALDLMNAAIRAGHSLSSAMGMAAKESPEPVRREFRQCYEEQNFGLELRLAFTNLAYRVPIHDIRIVVAAVLIQNESGGNLTEILDRVAHLIREDFRLQGEVRVKTAQGRITGWILSLLPAILGVLLYMAQPEQMSVLWTTEAGRVMLYGSLASTTVGALIIRKIVRIQV
jgi:tight adherence protein B